jgi:ribosomal-protein-alanine acetyltransferase
MSAAIRAVSVPPAAMPQGPAARVERGRIQQVNQLLEIEARCFGEDSYREEFFRKLCEDNRELLFVARQGRIVAGYVMGEAEADRAEVISLAVSPEYRGRGISRQLMHAVLRAFQRGGQTRAFLMVRQDNPAAINLYRSLGFRRIRRVPSYYHDGQDAIRMRMELD